MEDFASNHDRILADAKERLSKRVAEFIDAQGNLYYPHPDGVEVKPKDPARWKAQHAAQIR
jgi:hypothetical protein